MRATPSIAAELPPLEAFVRQLGEPVARPRDGASAAVQNLPERRRRRADAGRTIISSSTSSRAAIRWSYPALSNEQVRWQQAAAASGSAAASGQLAADGFAAILIDRYGYEDNGRVTAAVRRRSVAMP